MSLLIFTWLLQYPSFDLRFQSSRFTHICNPYYYTLQNWSLERRERLSNWKKWVSHGTLDEGKVSGPSTTIYSLRTENKLFLVTSFYTLSDDWFEGVVRRHGECVTRLWSFVRKITVYPHLLLFLSFVHSISNRPEGSSFRLEWKY